MSSPTSERNPALRLTGSTRSQILCLLRRGERTVGELRRELGITGNAVRGHLQALGRERLVTRRGVRRDTGGKPAHLYRLTDDAERLFPKAYAAVLDRLLQAVTERLGSQHRDRLLRQIGRDVAADLAPAPNATLEDRVRTAAKVLEDLGGATKIDEDASAFVIRGSSCPLVALVAEHPELCRMTEALMAVITGAEARERCDRGDVPACEFEVPKA